MVMLNKSAFAEADRTLVLDKKKFLKLLFKLKAAETLVSLRKSLFKLKNQLNNLAQPAASNDSIELSRDRLFDDLNQIEESLTLKRARYYITRLEKSITEIRTS